MLKLNDILKVGDMSVGMISPETYLWLKEQQCAYKDQILNENLYSIDDFIENEADMDIPDSVKDELLQINDLLEENDCAYLRITVI